MRDTGALTVEGVYRLCARPGFSSRICRCMAMKRMIGQTPVRA